MELKLHDIHNNNIQEHVLIVPLWNWNYNVKEDEFIEKGSNCTFMELKFESAGCYNNGKDVLIVPLWN